jgi:hypothetical protein
MTQQGREMGVIACEDFAYTSVELVLLAIVANGEKYGVHSHTFF